MQLQTDMISIDFSTYFHTMASYYRDARKFSISGISFSFGEKTMDATAIGNAYKMLRVLQRVREVEQGRPKLAEFARWFSFSTFRINALTDEALSMKLLRVEGRR